MSEEKPPVCPKCKKPMKLSNTCWVPQCQCFTFTVEDTPENRRQYGYQDK